MTAPIGSSAADPSPQLPPSLDGFDDAMSDVYLAISKIRQNDVDEGQVQVTSDEAEVKRQDEAENAAIQQQKANSAHSGRGFFSSIGHLVGDVASDVAKGHFGSAIDDGTRDLGEAWKSPQFWGDLKTGLEDVAIAAAAVSSIIVTAGVAGVAVGAGVVAAVGAVGATAGAGAALAGVRTGDFAANAEDATADATAASNEINELQEITSDALADLKDQDKSHEQAIQGVTQAIQTHDDAAIAPASMTVRG
jgi:hypothetical protein